MTTDDTRPAATAVDATDGTGAPTTGPGRRVGRGWIAALSTAMLGFWLAALTPIQILLPLQVQSIDPEGKVADLSLVHAVGALVAIVACPLAGALSDRTRSRFGRRRPFVLGGAVGGAIGLALLSRQQTVLGVIVCWAVVQGSLNAVYAGLMAAVPDRVPVRQRGVVSAFIGLQGPLALVLGAFVVTTLLTGFVSGYVALAVLLMACALAYVLHRRGDTSTADTARRVTETWRQYAAGFFVHPWRAPDFRWAFLGRFAIQLANAVGTLYILYFLRDAVGVADPQQGTFVLIALYTAGIVPASVVVGWASDRTGRRKVFVFGSSMAVAGALAVLAFSPTWTSATIAAVLLGAGIGAFLAVDNALITQVLPSAGDRGRDLGVINLANTAPQLAGPLVAGLVISLVGSYTVLYVIAGAIALAGAGLISPIRGVR